MSETIDALAVEIAKLEADARRDPRSFYANGAAIIEAASRLAELSRRLSGLVRAA